MEVISGGTWNRKVIYLPIDINHTVEYSISSTDSKTI